MRKSKNMEHRITFRITESEYRIIEEKAVLAECRSVSDYLRRIAIDGAIIQYNSEELNKLKRSIIGIQTNINQIAMRVNSTGNFYQEDMNELQRRVGEIWQSLIFIQSKLQ